MRKMLLAVVASALAFGAGLPAAKAEPWGYGPPAGYREWGDWRTGPDRGGPPPRRHHRDRGFNGGDALLGGAVGLAAGALLGSALAAPGPAPVQRYYQPAPPAYDPYAGRPTYVAPPSYEDTVPARPYRPARQARYYDDYGTSTRGHVEACFARYRSYDPRTDTFVGYDGYRRRCDL